MVSSEDRLSVEQRPGPQVPNIDVLASPTWDVCADFVQSHRGVRALNGWGLFLAECSEDNPCEGLSRHATFTNFGMAFLTLFRVSTGDNWNGIMKDTLRECTREDKHCLSYLPALSPVYFVTFVLVAQFVLVNVVVAVLMKHLEESNKEAREDAEMDAEIELEIAQGSTAQPPSTAQVRLLGDLGLSPRFLDVGRVLQS